MRATCRQATTWRGTMRPAPRPRWVAAVWCRRCCSTFPAACTSGQRTPPRASAAGGAPLARAAAKPRRAWPAHLVKAGHDRWHAWHSLKYLSAAVAAGLIQEGIACAGHLWPGVQVALSARMQRVQRHGVSGNSRVVNLSQVFTIGRVLAGQAPCKTGIAQRHKPPARAAPVRPHDEGLGPQAKAGRARAGAQGRLRSACWTW